MLRVVRRPAVREFALIAAMYVGYSLSRVVTARSAAAALTDAHALIRFEHHLRVAPERWFNHLLSGVPVAAVPADYFYATLHYIVTPCVLLWLWRVNRSAYLPARRVLVVATLIGVMGFSLFPVMPPRMLPGFVDTMARFSADGWWGSAGSAPRGLGGLTDQYAAMPSLHVGWAVWCAWQIWRHARHAWARYAGLAYPVVIVAVVIGTANHFLVDAVAGVVVMVMAAALLGAGEWLAGQIRRGELRATAAASCEVLGLTMLRILGSPATSCYAGPALLPPNPRTLGEEDPRTAVCTGAGASPR